MVLDGIRKTPFETPLYKTENLVEGAVLRGNPTGKREAQITFPGQQKKEARPKGKPSSVDVSAEGASTGKEGMRTAESTLSRRK